MGDAGDKVDEGDKHDEGEKAVLQCTLHRKMTFPSPTNVGVLAVNEGVVVISTECAR